MVRMNERGWRKDGVKINKAQGKKEGMKEGSDEK
jgi:hypothetical protein